MDIPTPYNRSLEIASVPTIDSIVKAAQQLVTGEAK